jgi:CubicO group peptidase (beta-lactamase class C family)
VCCLFLICAVCLGPPAVSCSGAAVEAPESEALDRLLSAVFKPDQPGAAVLVSRKGEVLLRKGYGMSDLEMQIPIEPDMVFRLGSVTKQFTSVAVLMLEEDGRLSVKDPITRFLPDYPTAGHNITVEHLLTHTSGIRSYTSMPGWRPLWRKDFTVTELVDFFKNEPMDFAPDQKWLYNNSGYILLGAIIEKASGLRYEEFIGTRILEPLGMKHSYYDNPERIIPRRARGYQRIPNGFLNAPYLSMTQPYAAGSLASSVDDLLVWHKALRDHKLLKKESLAKAQRPYVLSDGSSTGYGYGWMIGNLQGRPTVEHGGGIHGFATYALALPEDDVYVAVLTNGSAGPDVSPERLSMQMAAIAIGSPLKEPVPITMTAGQLERYVGVYRINDKEERAVTREGMKLFSTRTGGPKTALLPLSEDEFAIANSLNRFFFFPDESGRIARMEYRPRLGAVEKAARRE